MNKILLIDGNAMLFRAYYATKYGRAMTTSTGLPTNAIYGFIVMLNKAMELIKPDKMLVAWDSGKPTFRHEKYDAYKGTRKQLDEELIVQFPIVREYLDAAGIVRYEQEGIEADDIIGTIASQTQGEDTIVLSSDRDLLQLIDASTSVLLMKKGLTEMQLMNEETLMETMQVTPRQIIELKGLMGDTADNIPGVAGVGEKTATTLLKDYGTVEGVYENIDAIKGKLKEKLIAGKENAFLSLWLATIIRDADIHLDIHDCDIQLDAHKLNEFFKKYEMNSLMIHEEQEEIKEEVTEITLNKVTKISKDILKENALFQLDCDLEEVEYQQIYGAVFANDHKMEYIEWDDLMRDTEALEFLSSSISKITYDLKELYHIAYRRNLDINGFDFDIMIAAFLVDGSVNSLDKFNEKYHISVNKEEVYGKRGKPKFTDETERIDYMKQFCAKIITLREELVSQMKEKNCYSLFKEIEMPLCEVLFEMEKNGITCDLKVLDEIAVKNQQKIDDLTQQIYDCAGHEFNINSPKQLAVVLYDELGLKAGKKRSTAVDVLEKLKGSHPIIELLMAQRKVQKLVSTYAVGLVKHVKKDGKIHTTFNQCLTTTGRLSSSDPNLQNISVRDEDGKEIRKAFVASDNCILLSADYSQIELRMLAHMANVKEMIYAFNENIDIHTQTAMNVFHVSHDEVTSDMRRKAKAVNFGIVYGISSFGLSEQLGISVQEAKQFIDRYFESYPNIQKFMEDTVSFCEEHGYVETLYHRRREIPEIHEKNYMMREFGKRAAMNAPIQGSSADLIKVAMNEVYNEMKKRQCKSKMILQIHDELIFEVVEDEIEMMKQLVEEKMQNAMKLQVPLVASASLGKNWYEAK